MSRKGQIAAGTAILLTGILAGTAAADPSSVSIAVKFADLDISKPPGALVLYHRIRAAARDACSYYWFRTDPNEARCVQDAIANAVSKINQPELFTVYNKKNKTSVPRSLVSQSR
jgi:UrcA family protein